ncbi:MAG: hypothetical protein QNJ14_01245 [Woeseiaceae bacterium]|nr:hypothetical protein [Woeseiaceae bacterium]
MNKLVIAIAIAFLFLAACGGGGYDETPEPGSLEAKLLSNTAWPYEAEGVLDIVEAGGFDDAGFADWGVGFLITDPADEFGVMIEINAGVAKRARFDIDSGRKVRVWLEQPKTDYDVLTYPISKIEAL